MAHVKEALVNLIGAERLSEESETLEAYSHDHSLVPARKPQLVVSPKSSSEVQAVVLVAEQVYQAMR